MAIFDKLVLEISLEEVAETLHVKFYLYELNFLPIGVSVTSLGAEDALEGLDHFRTMIFMNLGWR